MTDSTETKPSATPSFIGYQLIERENKKNVYIRVGASFAHKKGKGHTLLINAMPLDGKIVLFVPSEKPE